LDRQHADDPVRDTLCHEPAAGEPGVPPAAAASSLARLLCGALQCLLVDRSHRETTVNGPKTVRAILERRENPPVSSGFSRGCGARIRTYTTRSRAERPTIRRPRNVSLRRRKCSPAQTPVALNEEEPWRRSRQPGSCSVSARRIERQVPSVPPSWRPPKRYAYLLHSVVSA